MVSSIGDPRSSLAAWNILLRFVASDGRASRPLRDRRALGKGGRGVYGPDTRLKARSLEVLVDRTRR